MYVNNFFYIIWNIAFIYISSAASTFGACVVLFFFTVFHRFTLICVGLRGIRNRANETWATQNLNKLAKYSEQLEPSPLPMRYPAFSWEMDITMGLWEGFTSIIGYALMLAVSISFVPHFGGKKIAVNRDSLVFFF